MIDAAGSPWAIVFDLDDTLYPESDFVLSGFRAVDQELTERGIQGFQAQAVSLFQQGLRGKIFDAALENLGIQPSPELIAQLVQVYRSHRPQLQLFPDARWAIHEFAAGIKVGLLTDGFAATQRNKVEALGLGDRFSAYVYTDDFGRDSWKPSPLPFRKIAAMLGMESKLPALVYIADNPTKDFIAPNDLGWTTIRVRRTGGEYQRMEPNSAAHAAHHEIESLEQLPKILGARERQLA